MKFPNLKFISSLTLVRLSIAAIIVAGTAAISFGQKVDSPKAELAGGDLDQCQNGAIGGPVQDCSWVNGNLNRNNSQWREGFSVPYRLTFAGLQPNTEYTIVLGYDTTEGGIHTLDYLTTYNRTQNTGPSGNGGSVNPCLGLGPACNPAVETGSYPIPLDPRVSRGFDQAPGSADDIAPGPDGTAGTADDLFLDPTINWFVTGYFKMFGGGTIVNVVNVSDTNTRGFTYNGTYAGNSQAFITLTFNTGPNPSDTVLTWSGHIATRFDWGFDNAAVQLTGSPYHMRTAGGTAGSGNQDRSMKIDAVVFPALVVIRKEVSYFINGVQQTTAPTPFTFNTTGFTLPTPWDASNFFQLIDNRSDNSAVNCGPNGENPVGQTDALCIPITNEAQFGVPLTVTESGPPNPWQLLSLNCSISGGGNNQVGDVNTSGATATIVVQEANIASCTYVNTITTITAAPASIAGRVTTAEGTGIGQVLVSVMNLQTGEITYAYTNSFGNYSVEGLEVEQTYQVSVWNRKMSFGEGQRVISLDGDLFGVDFVAESR